jgi:hypothetical protein
MAAPAYLMPAGGSWTGCLRETAWQYRAEGLLGVQCPISAVPANDAATVTYQFLMPQGRRGPGDGFYVSVYQLSPGALERNLVDNAAEYALP